MIRLLASVSIPRIRENRLRTTLTVLGIGLGVAVLVAVLIVNRSIVRGVTATIDDVAGKADLQVSGSAGGFDEGLLDTLRAIPGVHKITPAVQQIVTIRKPDGGRERMLLLGVDLLGTDDAYFRTYASTELDQIRRDPLTFLNSEANIILSRTVAKRLGVKLHDKISIASASGVKAFEVWGFIDAEGVGRAFGSSVAVMYYPAMQVAFGRGRNLDRIDIAVTPGTSVEPVARAIQAKLGAGFTVERPSLRSDRVDKMLRAVKTALTMSSIISLIAGAFLVFNTISISIVQRKRELGVLRALGVTRSQLIRLLTLEGALLGLIGSAVGVAIAIVISKSMLQTTGAAVGRVYLEQSVSDVDIDAGVLLIGVALGISTSIAAAWLATQRVAGLKPVDAWSNRGTQLAAADDRRWTRSDLVGIGLLVVSAGLSQVPPVGAQPVGPLMATILLTLAGRALMPRLVRLVHSVFRVFERRAFGVEAKLASQNLPRDVSRTASTAAGLMAGVALTLSVATFIISFVSSMNIWAAQSVPGDLFVTSGTAVAGLSSRNTPMAPDVGQRLDAIAGVERVRPMRFVDIAFRGTMVKLLSSDIQAYVKRSKMQPLEGTQDQIVRDVVAGKVSISDNLSSLFDLHKGDSITLPAKNGDQTFEIAGVAIDYSSDRGSIFMDRSTYVAHFQDDRIDTFELHLAPGVKPESVRAQIDQELGEKYDLFVLTNSEFRGELVDAVSQVFALLNVLEIVTLLVAALGMLTALLANVLDRVREIGVLRAVGMLRKQVRKLVMIEATFIGVVGTLGGILLGSVLGYVLLRYVATAQLGWYLPYTVPVGSTLQLVAITLSLSALAGYLPARRAAALKVTEALSYE